MSKYTLLAIFSLLLALTTEISAKSITEDPHYSFEALFTNPLCKEYKYSEEVLANNGDTLTAKPKNVYCTNKDKEASGMQPHSPQQRLVEWIQDPNVASISLAYFSFSDTRVLTELCSAIQRGVKVVLILDTENGENKAPQDLKKCGGSLVLRGSTSGIELAHIKLVLFELKNQETLKVVFSSGNLTAGTVLHHENWSFIQVSREAYFAQDQLCAYSGMVNSSTGSEFRKHIKDCRSKIATEPEDDIKSFFIPADNKPAIELFVKNILESSQVQIAAHRFSNKKMIEALHSKLGAGEQVQLIVDDDVYWSQKGMSVGANTKAEATLITALQEAGAQVEFMETNHYEKLLHHNKFAIYDSSVWTGAGNLTGAGFSGNYENFYYITIPEVVDAFKKQYTHMWDNLSTSVEHMPQRIVKPDSSN